MSVDLTKISGKKKNIWWMNPQDGKMTFVGETDSKVTDFTIDGAYLRGSDRVLIAVDSAKDYFKTTQTELEEKD